MTLTIEMETSPVSNIQGNVSNHHLRVHSIVERATIEELMLMYSMYEIYVQYVQYHSPSFPTFSSFLQTKQIFHWNYWRVVSHRFVPSVIKGVQSWVCLLPWKQPLERSSTFPCQHLTSTGSLCENPNWKMGILQTQSTFWAKECEKMILIFCK